MLSGTGYALTFTPFSLPVTEKSLGMFVAVSTALW